MELKASSMPTKHSVTKLHPQPATLAICIGAHLKMTVAVGQLGSELRLPQPKLLRWQLSISIISTEMRVHTGSETPRGGPQTDLRGHCYFSSPHAGI